MLEDDYNTFWVNPAALSQQSQHFRDAGGTIYDASRYIRDCVPHLGSWGNDAIGSQFGAVFMRVYSALLSGSNGLAEVAESVADGLETMSNGFTRVEENAVDIAKTVFPPLGGEGPGHTPPLGGEGPGPTRRG